MAIHLSRNTNDTCKSVSRQYHRRLQSDKLTAGWARTSVTGLLGLLVATLAEVISTGVDDDSALEH
jgi:hypothetical protein